ncbi:MAG: pyridoxamine 5'-phosphate oxidase family protein [Acidimicrobiales bacterium]
MWIDAEGSDVLSVPECRRLLAVEAGTTAVGRIGVPTDRAPVVVPVNFGVRDNQVYVRVGEGFFAHAAAGQLVAFEIDHVNPSEGEAWSVLVRGLARLIDAPDDEDLALVARPLVPKPGDRLLEIRPDVLTGRRFELHRAG